MGSLLIGSTSINPLRRLDVVKERRADSNIWIIVLLDLPGLTLEVTGGRICRQPMGQCVIGRLVE